MIGSLGSWLGQVDGAAIALDIAVEVVAGVVIATLGGVYALSRRRATYRVELARSIADATKLVEVIAVRGLPAGAGQRDDDDVQAAAYGLRFVAQNVRHRFEAVEPELRGREVDAVRAFLTTVDEFVGMLPTTTRRSPRFWQLTTRLLTDATVAVRKLGQAKRYRSELVRLRDVVAAKAATLPAEVASLSAHGEISFTAHGSQLSGADLRDAGNDGAVTPRGP